MACIGRHLCVVGGVTHGGGGQVAHRQDCCLYDTAAGSWDVLDGGAFEPEGAGSGEPATVVCMAGKEGQQHLGTPGARAGSSSSRPGSRDRAAAPFLGAGSCAFQGSRLLLLKPAPEGGAVGQLWTVDLTLPDTTQQMAEAKASAHAVVQELQLSCDAVEPACVRWVGVLGGGGGVGRTNVPQMLPGLHMRASKVASPTLFSRRGAGCPGGRP